MRADYPFEVNKFLGLSTAGLMVSWPSRLLILTQQPHMDTLHGSTKEQKEREAFDSRVTSLMEEDGV